MNARRWTAVIKRPSRVAALTVAVASVVLLTAAGCTSGTRSGHATPRSTRTTVAVDGFTTPDLGSKPPPGPPVSAAEAEIARQSQADKEWATLLAQHPSAIRPTVQLVAYASGKALSSALVECVRNAGYTATLAKGGKGWTSSGATSTTVPIPEDLATAYAVALYVCSVQHSSRPAPPRTPAELRFLYTYLTKDLGACWTHFGFTLDAATPSQDDFVASNGDWFPARSGRGLISEAQVERACPVGSPLNVE